MSPALRKLALTTHVVSSVGWLGAVFAFLGLSLIGMLADAPETVRGAYITMEATALWVLVPFSLASLASGLVQALGTQWGLLRHYWVIAKLVINVVASVVLLLYTQTLATFAEAARAGPSLDALRSASPAIHAAAALVLLVAAAALSVYKPRGVTRRGWRRQQEQRRAAQTAREARAQAA